VRGGSVRRDRHLSEKADIFLPNGTIRGFLLTGSRWRIRALRRLTPAAALIKRGTGCALSRVRWKSQRKPLKSLKTAMKK